MGYQPRFKYNPPVPKLIGWSIPDDDSLGPVDPSNYTNPAIICHIEATPAPLTAPCQPGATVELQWNPWPEGHKGPVLTYLANCNGPCESVDPTKLEFFKIQELGLLGSAPHLTPGYWATDKLIEANTTWTVEIPKDIAPGNYVLRHELIALHSAHELDGAQNYPQCINLQIDGSGTATPKGVPAMELYKPDDKGIHYNIWAPTLAAYTIPGPPLYTGQAGGSADMSGGSPVTSTVSSPTTSATAAGFATANEAGTHDWTDLEQTCES